MTVEFINLPVNDMTYMGITSDTVKSVVVDGAVKAAKRRILVTSVVS